MAALPRLPLDEPLAIDELLQALMNEVIEADANMQLQQRAAWRDATGNAALVEGLDRLTNLGLAEVRFTFCLEPVQRSWLDRVWSALTSPFHPGASRASAGQFRLASNGEARGETRFAVTAIIARSDDGRWESRLQSTPPLLPR